MKKSFMIIALSAACAHAGNWNLINRTDPMTDEVSYILYTQGTKITIIEDTVTYTPRLIYRLSASPNDDKPARTELFFEIETEGIRRGTSTVKIRFDSDQAEDVLITSSTDRRAGFFKDATALIYRLITADRLMLRFTTTLGEIRTTSFTTSGFGDSLKQLKKQFTQKPDVDDGKSKSQSPQSAWSPPTEEAPPPKAKNVTCPKCHGSGSVDAWRLCSSCNGSTRGCASCRNSGWTGHTKATGECPKCKGFGTIKPPF